VGLLLTHKSTVRIFPDMVTVSENRANTNGGGGKRNEITDFSRASRYRLFRLLHSIRFSTISFVTLTYGETFPTDGRASKKHLKAYRRAFERRWGKVRAIWRLELQKRTAPHFHILYFDCPYIPVGDWCDCWDNASHRPKEERFGNSLDLRFNRERKDSQLIGYYTGKYIGKEIPEGAREAYEKQGRFWGRWNIEDPSPIEIEVYPFEAQKLAKLLLPSNDVQGWHPVSTDSYTVFGPAMGRDDLRKDVLNTISLLLSWTRRVEGGNRTVFTCNQDSLSVK